MNLGQLISNYMKFMELVKSASPHTLRAYQRDLDQAFGPCKNDTVRFEGGAAPLLRLARKAQLAWANLSASSRNRKAATLKSFFGHLYREGLLNKDLALLIQTPRVPGRLPNFLSVDEVMAALKSYSETEQDHDEKLLFLLLYGGGLRVSEACTLSWKQIDFPGRILRITGKGSKERLVALPKSVLQVLRVKQKRSGNDRFVWGEKAMDPRAAYEKIRSRGHKAGLLRPLHPHALRHSYATHLLSSGANLRTLQELLGHESLRATEKYTHLGIDHLARTLESHHPLSKIKISS